MHARLFFIFFSLYLLPSFVFASDASYMATVPVASQSQEERIQGFYAALTKVVNQVSGNKMMANQLKINKLDNLYPYIKRYYYLSSHSDVDEDEEDDEGEAPEAQEQQSLVVEFEPLAVDNLIKTLNQSFSSDINLTPVLLWLAINENNKSWMLSNETQSLGDQIKFTAKSKNLSIVLPMMDIDDINTINTREIEGFDVSAISQASIRYATDFTLIGSIIEKEPKSWSAKWMLLKNQKRFTWIDHGVTLNGVILSGLLKAAEMITAPSSTEGQSKHLVLTVSGVNNVTDYASINAYLQQLPEVSSLQVLRVEASKVILDIILADGEEEAFEKTLRSNPHFISEVQTSKQDLHYQWKKN
ncbi:MAG: hypothetical protein ACD_44C00008G0002 [uncultured bacterium]|nr:MAG: hypothetical protein ACD_44C00008G0002 [uncultured bacterium]OGT16910.1 MAG: hypothetical protein A3B69_06090 [Gammaproteobacteria bacterium RIFCSPHIGHO2_02_FULL_38_33]OGT24382.1 MAG: hypothetical protein A2W47_02365 [Gammaproteobacteria bacterium RIFCSPHIGHO2_12_38_15]OGT68584.1 MAG: hypothetical protein A3I12_00290 [Gammaproteobacteria bacterium RIFCSPLOWO2_02_FULL_38_11]OGT75607.1 MAG: hypothetical protein A3G71_00440 [Gammaproteobacteria bacterium RIFCSPLOWO2_12_FULL_38_14]